MRSMVTQDTLYGERCGVDIRVILCLTREEEGGESEKHALVHNYGSI